MSRRWSERGAPAARSMRHGEVDDGAAYTPDGTQGRRAIAGDATVQCLGVEGRRRLVCPGLEKQKVVPETACPDSAISSI